MWQFLLALLTLTPHVFATNPGIKGILTSKGLQYGSHVGANLLQQKISSTPIPDYEGDISIGFLGSVHFQLTSMKVVKFNLPEPTVDFYNGTGFKFGMDGLSVAVHGSWHTHYSFIHDGGTFDLAVFNIGLSTLLQLSSDDQGHPSVTSLDCSASIKQIDINFYGGASFIFQPFVDHMKGNIQNVIQGKICPIVRQSVDNLEHQLAEMAVSFQVNDNLILDIPLLISPIIRTSDLELDVKGVFYSTHQQTEPPFSAGPFELTEQADFMLNLGLSEFTANSALYAYFSAGLLQVNITDAMIPKFSPIRLNTTSLGHFIPQLPKLFPNMLVLLQTYATVSPMVSFDTDTVLLNVSWSCKAYGIQPNATLTPFFRLDLDAIFNNEVFISAENLTGSTAFKNVTLRLGSSEIGTFQVKPLQEVLEMGIKTFLVPEINQKLKAGIPLPNSPKVHWTNTNLKVNKDFVAVTTDAEISLNGAAG